MTNNFHAFTTEHGKRDNMANAGTSWTCFC